MTHAAAHRTAAGPGDRLVRLGGIVFLVGLVAVVAAVVPFFFGRHNLPTWVNGSAFGCLSGGFALALIGLLRSVRGPAPEDSSATPDP